MAQETQSFCVSVLNLPSATISGKFTVPHVYWISPRCKDKSDQLVAFTEQSHWSDLLQIADLGVTSFKTWNKLTKEEHNEQRKINSTFKENGCTLHYMAPEHLNDVNAKPSKKSDVYSFAIVLWAIFANKEPYESKTFMREWDLGINQNH